MSNATQETIPGVADSGWGFTKVWNTSLEQMESRPMKARDNLWASELGKSPIDLFLKMKAVEPTNPPNARSLRKFEAGNVFEWVVSLILKRAGILQESQKWSSHQYPGLLKVTGKADFICGGKPDLKTFKEEMARLELPQVFVRSGNAIMEHFATAYPNGLASIPLEIKSVGSYVMDGMERTEKASKNHRVQTFHYLISENRNRANIVYICRDDLRMMEFPILNPSEVEQEYKGHIAEISEYVKSNTQPPKAPLLIFDEEAGKFNKNWNVEYSNYLTMLYGFETPRDYSEPYKKMAARFNRLMSRMKLIQSGAKDKKGNPIKLTPNNVEIDQEMRQAGYAPETYVSKFAGEDEDEDA